MLKPIAIDTIAVTRSTFRIKGSSATNPRTPAIFFLVESTSLNTRAPAMRYRMGDRK